MDIQANQTTDSVLKQSSIRRPFYRYAFFMLLLSGLVVGVFSLFVMTQARSNAQAEQRRAMVVMLDTEQGSRLPELPTSRLAEPVPFSTPALQPSSKGFDTAVNDYSPSIAGSLADPNGTPPAIRMQAVTRMVPQIRTLPVFDPVTKETTLTQNTFYVPVTTMEPSNNMGPTPDLSMEYQPFEEEIRRLSERFRSAELSQRDSLSEALTRKLTELFDARHKAQTSRVEAIRAEVQQTQELLDKRLQLKSQIVDRRLKELTGQRDELSWNPTVANALPSAVPIGVPRKEMGLPFSEPVSTTGTSRSATYPATYPDSSRFTPSSNPAQPIANTIPMPMPSNQESRSPLGPMPNQIYPDISPQTRTTASSNSLDLAAPSETISPNLPNPSLPSNPPQLSTLNPQPNNTVPTTGEPTSNPSVITGTSSDPQRSFMSIGFKLKKLIKDLAELNANNSESGASKAAINLKNAIDETRSVWDFEKSSLQLELETTESEYGIVKNQLERTIEIAIAEKSRYVAGVSSNDLAKTELSSLEIERQLLQLRSRLASFKKSLDWMARFEETVLKQD